MKPTLIAFLLTVILVTGAQAQGEVLDPPVYMERHYLPIILNERVLAPDEIYIRLRDETPWYRRPITITVVVDDFQEYVLTRTREEEERNTWKIVVRTGVDYQIVWYGKTAMTCTFYQVQFNSGDAGETLPGYCIY